MIRDFNQKLDKISNLLDMEQKTINSEIQPLKLKSDDSGNAKLQT